MRTLPAALLTLALSAPALGADDAGRPVSFHALGSSEQVAALMNDDLAKPAELADRLALVSRRFLGTPYVLGPLGEGPQGEFDRGPLVSFSALDCTTFVEETMAFALAGSYAEGLDLLRRIRYRDGIVSYETRNHFPETDWLPNLRAAGFLADVTGAVAGERVRVATKVLSKRAWYRGKTEKDLKGFDAEPPAAHRARLSRLRARGEEMPDEKTALPYLPVEVLEELLPAIPSGTVASLVREGRPDKPTLVTHQFFIMDGPQGKVVRHAAFGKAVEDVPAPEYFARLKGSSWRVLGINLAEVRAP
ncbi:MAG: N-acetylmuramoyl-L-alanine amidase-like domain-containing protein [Elusimicrobiota bacterium]|jgi:hypothetical protein